MTYAHITADTITALGNPPDLEWDGTRWWDLRDPTIRQARGWHEVTETPRPDSTTEGTYDSSVVLVDGLPVRVWTPRPWTAEELAAQADAAAQVNRFAAVESAVLATVDLTAKPWTPVTGAHDAVPPQAERVMDDGHTYRNISGQWLSHSPYEYPRGYECLDCEPVADWAPWVQPVPGSGTNEPYAKDAKVTHKDQRWISDLDGNVWEPGVYGWTLAP